MSYWVVGGEYEDTTFKNIKSGKELQKLGPFETYDLAKKEWDKISWEKVDICNERYIILPHK